MKSGLKFLLSASIGASVFAGSVCTIAFAADAPAKDTAPAKVAPAHEAADQPNPKHDKKDPSQPEAGFEKRHEGFLADLKKLGVDWTAADEVRLRILGKAVSHTIPLLPERLRYFPIAYEARQLERNRQRLRKVLELRPF